MPDPAKADTEELLRRTGAGDAAARQRLLSRHQSRLRRMVAGRFDRRLSARLDPSDIVQEALTAADRQLAGYLRDRPLPFYPWLRHLAARCLIDVRRHHLLAGCRSVGREEGQERDPADITAVPLADRLLASDSSPSRRLIGLEQRERVRAAIGQLSARDREILVMRYLEPMAFDQIATVLGLSLSAVKMRHLRALERLRGLLDGGDEESRHA